MQLSLYGDKLTLNGDVLALYLGDVVPVAAPRGDDAFRTSGARERFWQAKAEEELGELLEHAEAALSAPVEARQAVADEFQLIEWEDLPQARQIGEILSGLTAPQPDHTHLAALILAQMERIEAARIKARRKRDIEAIMVLM